jgi:glycosyltransferase involved in cell wall biosynthesis
MTGLTDPPLQGSYSPTPPYLSVIVPVYDEVESLSSVHSELVAALAQLGVSAEIVYVDDGSTDGSTQLLYKLQLDQPDLVSVVVLRRNFGKSGALAAGFAAARGEILVTLDADGQDVPAELPTLLRLVEEDGYDLVGGWRRERVDRFAKRLTSRWYNACTRAMTGLQLHDCNTGFKVLRAEVAAELPLYGELHRFLPVLAHDLGFRVGEVPVHHRPRTAGRSKYLSLLRFPKTLLDLLTVLFLTRFADRPLYFFGAVGSALGGAGLLILTYLSAVKLLTGAGIGQRPLLLLGVLAVLVGLQLVATGFIGDVLRHWMARERRPYRVRQLLVARPDHAGAHVRQPHVRAGAPGMPSPPRGSGASTAAAPHGSDVSAVPSRRGGGGRAS